MKKIIPYLILLLLPFLCFSQKQNDTLSAVKVLAQHSSIIVTKPTPIQLLGKSDLVNSISVADALKQLAGVFVKDYGGIGGLKTVSVRNLGANHTAVLYDGLIVADAQGGQTDLGKFSVDNVDQIQLYNSNAAEILLPARAFASASLITIKTSNAQITADEKKALLIKLQKGSFGYFSPAISYKSTLSKKIQTSIHAIAQFSKSNYPFVSYENSNLIERRNNSDLKAQNIEYDLLYKENIKNTVKFKAYWYNSNRGLPGAIIFYNSISNQRLKDDNLFIQSVWNHTISSKSKLLFSVKYSREKSMYIDPNYPNRAGFLENIFHQKEVYASVAFKSDLSNSLSVSMSSDIFKSTLNRTDSFVLNFATPSRNSFLQNAAVVYKKGAINLQGNILFSSINESVKLGKTANNLNRFSPAISFSVKPFFESNFYIRGFYKNIFRAPTFNDLYYTNIGNTNLLPEYAEQYNIGFTYFKKNIGLFKNFTVTVDAYLNNVKDKILAVPRQNLFQWSMQNIAIVKIKAVDVTMNTGLVDRKRFKMHTKLSYTFQKAVDLSDENSSQYKTQLPYTPAHNANFLLSVQYKMLVFIYNNFISSNKFKQGDAIPENIVKGFSSSDISFAYLFNNKYKLMAEANNIFNTQYEVIRFYPMPRFNYRVTFQISLKKLQKV